MQNITIETYSDYDYGDSSFLRCEYCEETLTLDSIDLKTGKVNGWDTFHLEHNHSVEEIIDLLCERIEKSTISASTRKKRKAGRLISTEIDGILEQVIVSGVTDQLKSPSYVNQLMSR